MIHQVFRKGERTSNMVYKSLSETGLNFSFCLKFFVAYLACSYFYIHIKLATVVEGDQKASFQ